MSDLVFAESLAKEPALKVANNLKVVYVACCHSETAGWVFNQAGVPHVVCIKGKDPISNNAAMLFTKTFYRNQFSLRQPTCDAFYNAKQTLKNTPNIGNEADKYILILTSNKKERDAFKKNFYDSINKELNRCDDCKSIIWCDQGDLQDFEPAEDRPVFTIKKNRVKALCRETELYELTKLIH